MADKALGFPQRVVVILRGPTGGMLACLLTASLLGGVAAAHPDAWGNAPAQQPSQASGQQEASATAPPTIAMAQTTCGVVLLALVSADDVHAVTRAIRSVRINCGGEPRAPGLLVALRHLRSNLDRHASPSGAGTVPSGSGGPAEGGAGGSGSSQSGGGTAGGGGQDGSSSGSTTEGGTSGTEGSDSGSSSESGSDSGSGGRGGAGSDSGDGGGHGGSGSGSGGNGGTGTGSGGPSGGGPAGGGRQPTPTHH
jgi:hypothetical protein